MDNLPEGFNYKHSESLSAPEEVRGLTHNEPAGSLALIIIARPLAGTRRSSLKLCRVRRDCCTKALIIRATIQTIISLLPKS